MRTRHRIPFCVLAIGLVACSGAAETELFDGDGANGTGISSSPTDPTPSKSGSSSDTSSSPPASAPPPVSTTPPPGQRDPPPAGDDCTTELEPNDDLDSATPFDKSLCGKIDSKNDVDYGEIVAPDDATKMTYSITSKDGNVAHRFYVDGAPTFLENGGAMHVVPGATYTVELRLPPGSGGAKPSYRIDVTFE